jgi:hypothetical protein
MRSSWHEMTLNSVSISDRGLVVGNELESVTGRLGWSALRTHGPLESVRPVGHDRVSRRRSERDPAAPEVEPSPRSMRSFSSVIRTSSAFSRVWMIVPIWSICFVKLASAFAAAAELASFCWATSSF